MKIDRGKIGIVGLGSAPLWLGSFLTFLVLDASMIGNIVSHVPQPDDPFRIILSSFVFTGIALLIVLSMHLVLERRGLRARKMFANIIAAPIFLFSSIFLGQTMLLILFKGSSSPHILVITFVSLGSLAISMFSIVLMIADVIPTAMKNLFLIIYGGIYGTFLGIIIPTFTMFIIIPAIIVEDFLLIRRISLNKAKLATPEDVFRGTGVETKSAAMGFGDFVIYTLIIAHALSYFPIFVWMCSLLLSLTGIIINVYVLASKEKLLPAIPLPTLLALTPWFVHLTALTYFI